MEGHDGITQPFVDGFQALQRTRIDGIEGGEVAEGVLPFSPEAQ
jgi:hypothetical protein